MHGRSQQNLVVVLYRQVFEGLNDLRKEGIRNFGDNQSEDAGSPKHQSASLSVGVIAELIDDFPHSLGELRIDRGNTVDRSGHGGRGNLPPPCNLSDIHWVEPKRGKRVGMLSRLAQCNRKRLLDAFPEQRLFNDSAWIL